MKTALNLALTISVLMGTHSLAQNCVVLDKLGAFLVREGLVWKGMGSGWQDEASEAATNISLAPMTKQNVAAAQLLNIIHTHHAIQDKVPGGLRAAITKWAMEYLPKVKLLFPDEIERRCQEYKQATGEDAIYQNGYIKEGLWNRWVAAGEFPIVEAHDILTHLPSFLQKGVWEATQGKASFISTQLSARGLADINVLRLQSKNDPVVAATIYCHDAIRAETYEKLAYLVKNNGKSELVIQGNTATSLGFHFGQNEKLRSDNLKTQILDTLISQPHSIQELPQFNKFFNSSAGNNWKGYLGLVQKLGMEEPGYSIIHKKIVKIVSEELQRNLTGASVGPTEKVLRLTRRLAFESETDPDLQQFFNLESRVEVLRQSTGLLQAYIDWYRSRH